MLLLFTLQIFGSMVEMTFLTLTSSCCFTFFLPFSSFNSYISSRVYVYLSFSLVGSYLRSVLNVFLYLSYRLRLILLTMECATALVEDSIATTISILSLF